MIIMASFADQDEDQDEASRKSVIKLLVVFFFFFHFVFLDLLDYYLEYDANRWHLARLLVRGGTRLLREKLESIHTPDSLASTLNDPAIITVLKGELTDPEWKCVYPSTGLYNQYSADFDMKLTLKLLKTTCGLTRPLTGWNTLPPSEDYSLEADLARITYYCELECWHKDKRILTDAKFNYLWREIRETFLRIAASISSKKRNEWQIYMYIDGFLCYFRIAEKKYAVELKCWAISKLSERTGDALQLKIDESPWRPLTKMIESVVTPLVKRVKRIFYAATAGGVTTPQEILARGPLAVQIYNKALKEGKTNARRLPIMLIGQHGMGKTSLKKSLKGDPFNADEESTTGIELDPSYCKMTTEIWRPGKLDETTCSDSSISFEHQAARLIVRDMKDIKETSQATAGEPTQSANNSQPRHDQSTSHDTSLTAREISNTNGWGQEQEQPLIEPDMPDDVANLIRDSSFEDVKVDEEEQIYSVLWDFGGQSVYYAMHPLYLTAQAIYLLVYDLSRSPNDRAIPVAKHGLFRKLEGNFNVKTNLDYLDYWMSSVASLVSNGDDEVLAGRETEKLPSKPPPVFLVCTHADQPYCARDSSTLAAEIFGSLQGKPYSSHLFDSVFVVDNTKSGGEQECPEVVRLRKEIIAVAKELPLMKEEIPLKWFKFEKELGVKIKEGNKWISLQTAKQVAFEMCHISYEEEFATLMKFFHDQRILIHFDDTPSLNQMVVLDIQWLINVLKKVIAVEPYGGYGKQYKELWLKLEKTGILEEKLLEHVWGPLYENKETFESLIEIMEKFSFLCIWPSSDESKQYLVPSMLMSHPSEDIIQLVASSQIPSLYLTFNSSQLPIGLFPRMVLQFYQWFSNEWPSPCKPQLFHNFARFHVCPDEGCSVILLCHSSFIEIVVHKASEVRDLSEKLQAEMKLSPNLAGDDTPDLVIARAVRRQVGLMLECMRNEFVWLRNMECEMKVLCSVCCPGGSVRYCRDHGTKGCKREECLHFWPETALQSGQQFVICDRSAVAGDTRLSIKQFATWFALLDQQQAIDDCAARELLSIEEKETKALVLSTGVREALQSTCDASNVVARLQDNLQLNEAALAAPEPETTRLIRCLATIAKNESRLDVVQHLRQITPAGTTGPLLPELLDVKKIPVSQIRKLTIELCGGEEWKLVAEKLGLSPSEIRYLHNRTMNPCIEALIHSRNQRFVNVDTLYNVLVECGLPMLADML